MRGDRENDVAIVGMACIFPGAGDLETFWRNVRGGHDAIREVSPQRWEPSFYDPSSRGVDRVYCNRGGFIDEFATFDAFRWGVMPVAAQAADPDQLLALEVAARALADAGYPADPGANARELPRASTPARELPRASTPARELPRASTGVILGRGGYLSRGMNRYATKARESEELLACLRGLLPQVTEKELAAVKDEFQSRLGHHGPDTVIGIVPNLAASRIANRLDLCGPSYTVDAACASALVAVDRACADLVTHRSDVVLAGGVHLGQDVSFWSVFCQLGALSRSQVIRPFDRRADGILIGEGVGIVVLKRRADAERDGDRIYALIRGSGVSSDGRGTSLMTPAVEGQKLALARAWRAAGLDPTSPASLGLIEAHGTGTPAGDLAELSSLEQFFGRPAEAAGQAGIGSIKSMIGHAMPAAGAAGLIKAALAVYHRTLPPTLHCEEPHEALARTRFRPVAASEPWEEGREPRRAGVNAFGFGGINAHVILEEAHQGSAARSRAFAVPELRPRALFLAAESPAAIEEALVSGRRDAGGGACRLAVLDPTPERLELARSVVQRKKPFHGRKGIWFSPRGLVAEGGKIAFAFPGVDADFRPRVADVARAFGQAELAEIELPEGASELERTGVGIVLVNRLLDHALRELGIAPQAVLGHSIGEWSAMIAAGVLEGAEVDAFIRSLEPGSLSVPGVFFATAGCGREKVEAAIAGLEGAVVSHDNCPHQVVICGPEASIDRALERLRAQAVLCQKLDFQSGFHTPLFAGYAGRLGSDIGGLTVRAPALPLWSATTARPYPSDPAAIRALFLEHLTHAVRFRELARALWDDGVRVFVQVGTGSLVGFLDDTLKELPRLVIGANVPQREGLEQLAYVAAALWVEGASVDLGRLFPSEAEAPASGKHLVLDLGTPLVRLERPLALGANGKHHERPSLAAAAGANARVAAEFEATLEALERSGADVARALSKPAAPPAAPRAGDPTAAPRVSDPAASSRAAQPPKSAAPRPAEPARPPAEPLPLHRTFRRRLDFASAPFLLDHCFFPQPEGWPDPGDRFPVVPMTMSLSMMIRAARELAPDRVVVGLERIRAFRWIAVEKPLDVAIDARRDGERVHVKIDDYIEGSVLLAKGYAPAPRADFAPCRDEVPLPMDARELYDGRWMFHGPSYQGVVELVGIGSDGIRGVIEERPAEGCLLDCAGQVFGLWIQQKSVRDKMAMPVTMESAVFHAEDPQPGARFDCRVFITKSGEQTARADLEISRNGRLWCRITGWEDRRFESDEVAWPVMVHTDRNLLAVPSERIPAAATLRPRLDRVATRDYFARRFLTGREIDVYKALNPRRQIEWLAGRIAAKDAVRSELWKRGHGPVFPIEIEVLDEPSGKPVVRLAHPGRPERWRGAPDLAVSIAHKRELAVAQVGEGRLVGIDVERIEPREPSFESVAFTEAERELLARAGGPAGSAERSEWLARFWSAKEAAAKAAGTGLRGDPSRFPITRVEGERLWAGGLAVDTLRDEGLVFAWVAPEQEG